MSKRDNYNYIDNLIKMLYKITLPLLQKVSYFQYFVSRPLASKEEARVNAQKRSTTNMSLEGVCLGKILHCSLTPYHTLFLHTCPPYLCREWMEVKSFQQSPFPEETPYFRIFSACGAHCNICHRFLEAKNKS